MTREHEAFDPDHVGGDADPLTGAGDPLGADADPLGGESDPLAGDAGSGRPVGDGDGGARGTGQVAGDAAALGDDAAEAGSGEEVGGGDGEAGDETLDLFEIGSFLAGSDELKKIVVQRDEYLDSLRRLQADFDNYRKRAIRQQTELVERATEGLLVRLLPVLDALDLAMAHLPAAAEGDDSEAMKSLTQIGTLLRDVLQREGLERIDQVGVPFDPTVHDAVAQTGPDEPAGGGGSPGEAQGEEGGGDQAASDAAARSEGAGGSSDKNSVASVMRSGYRLKGRVLRPAMVAVRT